MKTNNDMIPPQAIEIEATLLGTCLVYPDVIYRIKLIPEMFYKDAHSKIFAVILELTSQGTCDIMTVTDRLRVKNELNAAGGIMYITKLINDIVSDAMAETHALIIRERFLSREFIRVAMEIQNMAYTSDISDVIEFAESSLFKLSNFTQAKEPISFKLGIDELLTQVERIVNREIKLIGIPSGVTRIDRFTGGWQPGNLIIIAGSTSQGKTSLGLQFCMNAITAGYPVCFFSMEMSKMEICTRLLSGVTGYSSVEIRNASPIQQGEIFDLKKIKSKGNEVKELPGYIDDSSSLNLFELRSKVKKVILKYGVKMVIVDYLQLMNASEKGRNREQEISTIAYGLKAMALEFNIPVVALAQMNRSSELSSDKSPKLWYIRESGAISQAADFVCLIHRPFAYGIETVEINKEYISTKGLIILDCAKVRNSMVFTQVMYHNEHFSIIQDEPFKTKNGSDIQQQQQLQPLNKLNPKIKNDDDDDPPY